MENPDIASALNDVASLLEIQDANPFRVRAYRNAARLVRGHDGSVANMVSGGADLTELPGIGKDLARHIETLVREEGLRLLEELAGDVPVSLVELTHLPGLGAKRVKLLWEELGVTTPDELEEAALRGEVAGLAGFGKKTEQKIVESIERFRRYQERSLLGEADYQVRPLLEYLTAEPSVMQLEVAGSYRRRVETVSEVKLLAVVSNADEALDRFTQSPDVRSSERANEREMTARLKNGLRVRLRVVSPEFFGSELLFFTGSGGHVEALQTYAKQKGLEVVADCGVSQVEGQEGEHEPRGEWVKGESEEHVYEALGLNWIPPELRENRGEIQAAEAGELPTLIELGDIKGDLQMHSTWSDGQASLETMLLACQERGYEYFAITDHSKALGMVGGLDAAKLRRQWLEIEELAERHEGIRILRGMEVDILGDGSLDLEDEMLVELDVVLASVHSRFNLPQAQQTERVLTAMRHPEVDILAHPTGRLLNRRDPILLDMDAVVECAAEYNVALELNAHPARLDLSDTHLMKARDRGVNIVISTDAHSVSGLDVMSYGVGQARRAWLQTGDVLNALGIEEMLRALGIDNKS